MLCTRNEFLGHLRDKDDMVGHYDGLLYIREFTI